MNRIRWSYNILLACFIVISVIVFLTNRKLNRINENLENQFIQEQTIGLQNKEIVTNLEYYYKLNVSLNPIDLLNTVDLLSDSLHPLNNVIVLISEENCSSCIYKILCDLQIASENYKISNISIIGDFKNDSTFAQITAHVTSNVRKFNSKYYETRIPDLNLPFIIHIDENKFFTLVYYYGMNRRIKDYYFNQALKNFNERMSY